MGMRATMSYPPKTSVPPQKPHALLLTGAPGVGKTTVIRRVAEALAGRRLGGFYTEEIRCRGERRGFRLVGFDGTQCVIAHVNFPKTARVGKYGVDVSALDRLAPVLLTPTASELYLVDEISKMECLSRRFVEAVRALLAGPPPLIATVALKGVGFIAEVKHRPDVAVWTVTHANRDRLPQKILAWLAAAAAERRLP